MAHLSTNANNKCIFTIKYVGNSISELQIQVATYVFELSAGNCPRWMAALSSFILTLNDRYAHDCIVEAAVARWWCPTICVPWHNSVALCSFCGKKIWQQGISTKKCCPCAVEAAVTRWWCPTICVPWHNSVALCSFCGQKIWQQGISTKKCCQCAVNIACHVMQSIIGCKSSRKGRQVLKISSEQTGGSPSTL